MPSTAITLNEFYFALSTFQVSGKQINDMTLKYLVHFSESIVMVNACFGLIINKKPLSTIFFVMEDSSMERGELCCPMDILSNLQNSKSKTKKITSE